MQSRYDVSFSPERPKKMLPEAFAKIKARYFPHDLIAFDQMKNCYSLNPLKNVSGSERFSAKVSKFYFLAICDLCYYEMQMVEYLDRWMVVTQSHQNKYVCYCIVVA